MFEFGIKEQKYGNYVASFWNTVMSSYLKFMITERQTVPGAAQAVQIWFQNVRINLLQKKCNKIRVLIVMSLKCNVIQKRTVRASMLRR